ncbi:hypothetical protein FAI40_03350 [Acetobacteraceae bacterium]|nr:hypothetical protein FAI40_03350 [Acetobacteraceae bacterium]
MAQANSAASERNVFFGVMKNVAQLFLGQAMAGVLGLLFTILMARSLTPSEFGQVTLLYAWPRLMATLGSGRSWQVILHYGAAPLENGEKSPVQRAISFALGLDFFTLILATLVAVTGVVFFSQTVGVSASLLGMGIVASLLTIPATCLNSSTTGILRLFGRMGLVAKQEPYTAIIRLLLGLLVWQFSGGIVGFALAIGIATMSGQLYVILAAFRILKENYFTFSPAFHLVRLSQEMPQGVWRLMFSANLGYCLNAAVNPAVFMIVGRFFGPAAVAFFGLAETFLRAIAKLGRLLEESYYPDLARLDIRSSKPWSLVGRIELIALGASVLTILITCFAGSFIFALLGNNYLEALPLMQWMSPSLLFLMLGLPLEGLLYCAGKSISILWVQVISALSMFVFIAVFMSTPSFLTFGLGLSYSLAAMVKFLFYLAGIGTIFSSKEKIVPLHERQR